MLYLEVIIFLAVILAAALIFTNALEHLGSHLGFSEGVTGSIFAAVGTALPETMIPVLALLFAGQDQQGAHAIGVGAIFGAPLLLITLAMFLMALAAIFKRKINGKMQPEKTGLCRDLNFFIAAYVLAIGALFIPDNLAWLSIIIGAGLVLCYILYLAATIRASAKLVDAGHDTEAPHPMYLSRVGLPTNLSTIGVQTLIGLVLLIAGAEGFIQSIEGISHQLGISALLLSLIIAPIATELPEKVNSVLWIRNDRDTLAFGNVTGAMVFQGTLLPALGIFVTPWDDNIIVLAAAVATLAGALWIRMILMRGEIKVWQMLINGALYGGYLGAILAIS